MKNFLIFIGVISALGIIALFVNRPHYTYKPTPVIITVPTPPVKQPVLETPVPVSPVLSPPVIYPVSHVEYVCLIHRNCDHYEKMVFVKNSEKAEKNKEHSHEKSHENGHEKEHHEGHEHGHHKN